MAIIFTIAFSIVALAILAEALHKSTASAKRDLVSVILFSALLYLPMVDSIFFLMEGGSAHYLLMARSIASGHGLSEIWLPQPIAYTKTPFMLPLLLSLPDLIFGYNVLAAKFIIFIFAVLAGTSIFFLIRPLDRRAALLIAALTLASPPVLTLMRRTLTEIPYLGVSFAALYLMNKILVEKPLRRHWILLSVSIFVAYFLRTAGISLIAAFIVVLFLNWINGRLSREKILGGLLVILPTVTGAILWAGRGIYWRRAAGFDYLSEFFIKVPPYSVEMGAQDLQAPLRGQFERAGIIDLIQRGLEQSTFYVQTLGQALNPYIGQLPGWFFWTIMAGAVAVFFTGLISMTYRRQWLIPLYGLLFFIMTALWPYRDPRFIMPFVPVLILGFHQGIRAITGYVIRRAKSKLDNPDAVAQIIIAVLLLALLITGYFPIVMSTRSREHAMQDYRKSFGFMVRSETGMRSHLLTLLEWIDKNTTADSVFLFHSPQVVFLITDRKCVTTPITKDPEQFWQYVKDQGVNYIIVDELYREVGGGINMFTPQYLIPALNAHPENYSTAFRLEGTPSAVLRVK